MNKRITLIAGLSLGLALAAGAGISLARHEGVQEVRAEPGDTYNLVTDASKLRNGDTIMIGDRVFTGTNAVSFLAAGNDGNHRSSAGGKIDKEAHKVMSTALTEEITINTVGANWTLYAQHDDNKGYLYASSSSSAALGTRTENSDGDSEWAITIDSESGAASIIAQGANTYNVLTTDFMVFTCKTAVDGPVYIYKKAGKSLDSASIKQGPTELLLGDTIDLSTVLLELSYDDGTTVDVQPTSYDLDNFTVNAEAAITYHYEDISVNGVINVKNALKFNKTNKLYAHAKNLIVSDETMLNVTNSGIGPKHYNAEYISIYEYGKKISDDTYLVDASITANIEKVVWHLEPVLEGKRAGQYLIVKYRTGYSGGPGYLFRDTNGMVGTSWYAKDDPYGTNYFNVSIEEETGELLISPVYEPNLVMRKDGDDGFNFFSKTSHIGTPVYLYTHESYTPYVTVNPSTFQGYNNYYKDVIVNYQKLEGELQYEVTSGSATVQLLDVFNTECTKAYRIYFHDTNGGTIDFGGVTFTYTTLEDSVTSLAVTSQPTKTIYDIGEELDLTGLVITATYKSGKTEVVPNDQLTVSGFDSSAVKNYQTVYFEWGGKRAAISVKIITTPTGIELDTSKFNTHLYVGDELDLSKLVVNVVYTNGDRTPTTDYIVSGFDSSKPVESQTITITASGFEATFNISIEAVVSQGIIIYSNPIKLTYFDNEELDPTGLVVQEYFNNGSSRDLNVSEYTISGNMELPEGVNEADKTFTVSRINWEQTATFEVHVIRVQETGIDIITQPTKLEYWESEELDLTGLAVDIVRNNNTRNALSMDALTITGFTKGQVGQQTITVSYHGFTATFTVTVKAVYIVSLEVISLPEKVDYYVGDEINLEGIVVKATYSDGDVRTITITKDNLEDLDMSTAGEVTVTIKVGNVTTTFKINIYKLPAPAKKCGGSIAATSALLSIVAAVGITLVSLKKRKEK